MLIPVLLHTCNVEHLIIAWFIPREYTAYDFPGHCWTLANGKMI